MEIIIQNLYLRCYLFRGQIILTSLYILTAYSKANRQIEKDIAKASFFRSYSNLINPLTKFFIFEIFYVENSKNL